MLRFLRKINVCFIFILPLILSAQMREGKLPPVPKKINTYKEEKKLLDKAYSFLETDKHQEAYKISHRLLKKTFYKDTRLYSSIVLGSYFNYKNLADSALYYGNKSVELIGQKKDSVSRLRLSMVYNIIANAYSDKSLLEESKKWHLKGIEIAQRYEAKGHYYQKIHNLAATYIRLGEYDYAIQLLESCLQFEGKSEFTFTVYISLASAHSLKNNNELALSYLKKALAFFKNGEKSRNEVIILQNIGVQYHIMENYDEAIKYYNRAWIIGKENGFHRPTIDAMMNTGLVYQDQGMHDKATLSYKEALLLSENLGFLDKQTTIYSHLKKSAAAQNNFKESYDYFTKEIEIKDSIRSLQKEKEINELEIKFKTLEKEKEISILRIENTNRELKLKNQEEAIKNLKLQQEVEKKENEYRILSFQNASEKKINEIALLKKDQEIQESKLARQKSIKNTILYSFLILLIPIIGLLITYYQKLQTQSELNKKQEEISKQKITSLVKDQELKLIKALIKGKDKERKRIAQELHDSIGGNLAAIKIQVNNTVINGNKEHIKTINNQLDDTYEQVRDLSHNLVPKKFSKNNFSDVLEEYFNNIGDATNLKTSITVYPRTEIDLMDEILQIEIFKIIQELITNTIKHAKASSIELQLNLVEGAVNVMFEDNGVGFNTQNQISGIGFENIKSRLKTVSGTLHIDSRINRGTLINIEIPTLTTITEKMNQKQLS
ncbi:tetratricopeptide repeat-containing sensor histidine kinase [Aquimarina sediminis]|uniref:tetratricopeptide repeat-containing sensor histidine kinase n=1 Tax=Aquimarina sediminis TaxID=2070536 RepID=UPI0013E8AED6|nr:tetratricopeptide repeat-containing sensor histidine kinase [Aquimarina sediminis]